MIDLPTRKDIPKEITPLKSFSERRELQLADQPRSMDINLACHILPRENGKWKDNPGDSIWEPERDSIPQKNNLERKTWDEIFKEYGIRGIEFKDGYPDFSPIKQEEVNIDDFGTDRSKNFAQADKELAEQLGKTPREIKEMRQKKGLTWHECENCKTLQLVPSIIHNNIPHSGGISEAKKAETQQ